MHVGVLDFLDLLAGLGCGDERVSLDEGVDEEESFPVPHVTISHRAEDLLTCCVQDVKPDNLPPSMSASIR